ncbi:MAG: hypothetical protein Q8N23_34330 [Archangium sp.]|nr:hypothetical protein [Archangium sp.]MDP3571239.1 hypothetical protein [Archangium sp.]
MHFIAVRNLTLVSAVLLSGPAFARVQYCAQRLAPADQQSLPANAQALIAHGKTSVRFDPQDGGTIVWTPFIRRLNSDGGVQSLVAAPDELQPTGDYGNATLFLPGTLIPGERFRLESSSDCSGDLEPGAEVRVGKPAPLPETFGVPSLLVEPGEPDGTRELVIDIDDSVRPWLSVARVNLEVNGRSRSTDYGRLARRFDGGSRVFVDDLTRLCDLEWAGESNNTLQTWLIKLQLELPGVQERPPAVELTAEMACRQSCASVGVTPWLLGTLLLATRRFTSGRRRRNI